MAKLRNQVVEGAQAAQGGQGGEAGQPGQSTLDTEATVEVLNRILHMELSGVMQHFHHRWVARWLRTSRPRAVAVGQHIASLQGGTAVDVGDLMEEALAGSAEILNVALAHEEERLGEYRKLLELVTGRSNGLETFARTQIAADERMLAELSSPPTAPRDGGD
jgi:bacterioferritin (cytochrome b1)